MRFKVPVEPQLRDGELYKYQEERICKACIYPITDSVKLQ